MARGGYRPNSGPQKGAKYKPRQPKPKAGIKPKAPLKAEPKQKKKRAIQVRLSQSFSDKVPSLPPKDTKQAAAENLEPLAYMLKVMNDANEDSNRRDRMAIAAAPFCHARKGEGVGKKEEKESRAKQAGSGRFAASPAPLKVVK